ncbi:hypothetical protein [Paenibacillus massiliensis]|uniref:hypothetical protein n=1 Tax=Paenibacillus massiliensis TaxID=225917 RepID=UPI000409B376|nr:hypothetical protein [Paenibacillus massiliensis]
MKQWRTALSTGRPHLRIIIGSICVLMVLLLTACPRTEQPSPDHQPNPAPEVTPQEPTDSETPEGNDTEQQTPPQSEPSGQHGEVPAQPGSDPAELNPETFEAGVHINWDSIQDPLMDQDMLSVLQQFTEAVAAGDKATFEQLFPRYKDQDYGSFAALVEQPDRYRFVQVGTVIQEHQRRIVPINGIANDELLGIREFSNNLYMEQNTKGQWQIVSID